MHTDGRRWGAKEEPRREHRPIDTLAERASLPTHASHPCWAPRRGVEKQGARRSMQRDAVVHPATAPEGGTSFFFPVMGSVISTHGS